MLVAKRAARRSSSEPPKRVVDEHRERRCAALGELRCEQRRIGVASKLARGRRASLDLGDRAEPGRGEGVAEPQAATHLLRERDELLEPGRRRF